VASARVSSPSCLLKKNLLLVTSTKKSEALKRLKKAGMSQGIAGRLWHQNGGSFGGKENNYSIPAFSPG